LDFLFYGGKSNKNVLENYHYAEKKTSPSLFEPVIKSTNFQTGREFSATSELMRYQFIWKVLPLIG
jgi:hypothetical protein